MVRNIGTAKSFGDLITDKTKKRINEFRQLASVNPYISSELRDMSIGDMVFTDIKEQLTEILTA